MATAIPTLGSSGSAVMAGLRLVGVCVLLLWGLVGWSWRHRVWVGSMVVLAFSLAVLNRSEFATGVLLLGWALPAVVAVPWARWSPYTFDRYVAGPWRRRLWRVKMREGWAYLSRECGLSTSHQEQRRSLWNGDTQNVTVWADSRLCSVTTSGWTMTLTVQARHGQTSVDVVKAAGAIASAVGADTYTARPLTPSTASIDLVMADYLAGTVHSPNPSRGAVADSVVVGRAENSGAVALDPLGMRDRPNRDPAHPVR
ncbi:MAG: hypothetical protein WBG76_01545 [Ornithinimicrobium sp.]